MLRYFTDRDHSTWIFVAFRAKGSRARISTRKVKKLLKEFKRAEAIIEQPADKKK